MYAPTTSVANAVEAFWLYHFGSHTAAAKALKAELDRRISQLVPEERVSFEKATFGWYNA